VIGFGLESMRAHSKLTKGDSKGMHLMYMHIGRFNKKVISQLHEMLKVECWFRAKVL
jgi:hypothetical protein